jgi:protoporphyrin/coproporphyrin ferrochelatase
MGRYRGLPEQAESSEQRIGVLLVNLGTPDAPTYGPVRRYLGQFLRDRRVIELCPYAWWPVLYGPILTFRPRKSAAAYRKIWLQDGSPLLRYSQRLTAKLEREVHARLGRDVRVGLAMTYGQPSVKDVLEGFFHDGVTHLLVLPMYPQYSGTTTGAVFDAVARVLMRRRAVPELRFIRDYHDDAAYVDALAARIERSWAEAGRRSHLLLSYHGIPVKYVQKGDPYRAQALRMSRLIAERLGLAPDEWSMSFQSRFGPTEWLQPYTDQALKDLLAAGVRDVTVASPAFSVDCLETLEELGVEYRHMYMEGGGQSFTLVPALNDDDVHATALAAIVTRNLAGWPGIT